MMELFSKGSNITINSILAVGLLVISQIDEPLYRLIGTLGLAAIAALYSYFSLMANPPRK